MPSVILRHTLQLCMLSSLCGRPRRRADTDRRTSLWSSLFYSQRKISQSLGFPLNSPKHTLHVCLGLEGTGRIWASGFGILFTLSPTWVIAHCESPSPAERKQGSVPEEWGVFEMK